MFSGCQITSKAFITEITEVGPYPLLFFGRNIEAKYMVGIVEIDGWIRYSTFPHKHAQIIFFLSFCAPGKIVALILALRRALDELLETKIEVPATDITNTPVMKALVALFASADNSQQLTT